MCRGWVCTTVDYAVDYFVVVAVVVDDHHDDHHDDDHHDDSVLLVGRYHRINMCSLWWILPVSVRQRQR